MMKKHRRCNSALSKVTSPLKEKLKLSTWASHHGNAFTGFCYTCNRIIYYDDFRVGHLDVKQPITIDNVRPICKICSIASDLISLSSLQGIMSASGRDLVDPSTKSAKPVAKHEKNTKEKKTGTEITISCCMVSFRKRSR